MMRIFFLLLIISNSIYGHTDLSMRDTSRNVIAEINTGFDYEEHEKLYIAAKYISFLSEERNYKERIFIDFEHTYVDRSVERYFISYLKETIKTTPNKENTSPFRKPNSGLVIKVIASQIDIISLVKLADFAIVNKAFVEAQQQKVDFEYRYWNWHKISINEGCIEEILDLENNSLIDKVFDICVEREVKPYIGSSNYNNNDVTYYFQNGKYVIIAKGYQGEECKIMELENIYQLSYTEFYDYLVFENPSSFYMVSGGNRPWVSKKHSLIHSEKEYLPYKIAYLGGSKFSIYYFAVKNGVKGDMYAFYDIKKDSLGFVFEKDNYLYHN